MVIHLPYILINILCILYTNAQIVIKDAGTSRIQPTDIAMIFYLTIENVCSKEMYVSVRGVRCCSSHNDCESMKLIGGDPGMLYSGKTKNVTLIYPNLYLYGRQGVCTVLIVFKVGRVTDHLFRNIQFDTKRSHQDVSCNRCPCYTPDLDPFGNCSAVNCAAKYSGHKNFFNPSSKTCEPVPVCKSQPGCSMPEEMYDIINNRCVNVNCTVTVSDIAAIEESRIPACSSPYIFGNIVCHHGNIDKKTGACVCNKTWISSVSSEPQFVPSLIPSHMCNIRTGSWTDLNKDKLLLTVLVMMIMTTLLILKLCFLVCVLHFCYKWARSKAMGDSGSNMQIWCPCADSCNSSRSKNTRKLCREGCTCPKCCELLNLLYTPKRIIKCRSEGTMARTRYSDKGMQLEEVECMNPVCPNKGIEDKYDCPCEHAMEQTEIISNDSLLSDTDSDESNEGGCTCASGATRVCNITNTTYRASTYNTNEFVSTESRAASSSGTETLTQTGSNFSINIEYDTDDLELECSSSSEHNV